MVQVKFCWESLIYCFLLQLSLLCLGGGAVCVCAQRLQDERGLTKSNLGLELEEDFKAGHSCSGCSPHICQVKTKQRGLNIVQMCVKPNFRNQLSSSFLLKWRSQPDISEDRDGSTLHTLGAPRFSSSPQRSSCCSKNLSLAFPLSLVSSNPSVLSLSEQCKLQRGVTALWEDPQSQLFWWRTENLSSIKGIRFVFVAVLSAHPGGSGIQASDVFTGSQWTHKHLRQLHYSSRLGDKHQLQHHEDVHPHFGTELLQNPTRIHTAPAPTQTGRTETMMSVWARGGLDSFCLFWILAFLKLIDLYLRYFWGHVTMITVPWWSRQ